MKTYKLKINRWMGEGEVPKEDWKNLISSLVLAGYEVYGSNEEIVVKLGYDDKIEEITDEKN